MKDSGGPHVPAYGPVMGVATAIIALGIAFTVSVGPERKGRRFEEAPVAGETVLREKDVEMGAGDDEKNAVDFQEDVEKK